MIRLVIFDWDDVFTLHSKEGYYACYHKTLAELGVHLNAREERKRILAKWSRSYREELGELLKENTDLLDKACEIYKRILFGGTFINKLRLVDGSIELLKRLSKKYTLCIATGIQPRILEIVMQRFGVPRVFAQIITAQDIKDAGKQKPNPFMLEQIMRKQKARSNETVFVGDAKTDVIMARNAGVTPIVVMTGHLNRRQANALGVKHIIKDVSKAEVALGKIALGRAGASRLRVRLHSNPGKKNPKKRPRKMA